MCGLAITLLSLACGKEVLIDSNPTDISLSPVPTVSDSNSSSAGDNYIRVQEASVEPTIEAIAEVVNEREQRANTPTPQPTRDIPKPSHTLVPNREASRPNGNTPTTGEGEGGFYATRYGVQYNGSRTGCGQVIYSSDNPIILAAPPSRYSSWPCGTKLTIINPRNGVSLPVMRVDACPGCGHNHIDLSETGIAILCGYACDSVSGLTIIEGWIE